jgi:gamma-glutamyltranspeptidase/glutathione hydrolase
MKYDKRVPQESKPKIDKKAAMRRASLGGRLAGVEGVKGVVAAGHEATANAGKEILEAGGNAVDAAIASAFAGCAADPLLTGLGAGGYMLIHDVKTDAQELLDFAVVMPGKNLGRDFAPLTPTPVDFGETIQMFHGGHSSVGVPGFVAGICKAHKKYASMPLSELVKPAKKIAKEGVNITKQQAYLIKILFNVISVTPESKKLFSKNGAMLKEGDLLRIPELAQSLDEIAATKGASFYTGRLAELLVEEMNKAGGLITREDLAAYKVLSREPATLNYRGAKIFTNPPPSSGGALIAHSLSLLSHFDLKKMGWHSTEHLTHLLGAMLITNEVRKDLFDNNINEEDILDRLLAKELIESGSKKIKSPLGNTTHLSIIDAAGNAVSMTTTNGSGSGVAIPGTGILLNNILGEEDLNPHGFHKYPAGHRMTSMMSPTIVTENKQARLAIGSAGSSRIRSAILQTISAIVDFKMDVKDAINAPRIHAEGTDSGVELEAGIPKAFAKKLVQSGYQVNIWKDTNLFFGGVQAVTQNPKTGELKGAGDPRRGGVAVTAN